MPIGRDKAPAQKIGPWFACVQTLGARTPMTNEYV